jgi:hypothetical protein
MWTGHQEIFDFGTRSFAILNMGDVLLFFPGGPLIITRAGSTAVLPEEMMESWGAPVQVDSGERIRKIVEE